MKKLTRLLLINWHYFQHQMIDFGTINFLTGKNTVGKSTIIDALQIVLLGEIRSSAFNRAASKKSERTLKGYLVGALGEDIDTGVRSLREGKDFSSYIVAEFFDDMKESYFCTGAIFDTYANGSDIKKRFFWIRSHIPEHHFIISGKTMDSRSATKWFKEKLPNRYETKDTAEGYKKLLLSKFNVHEEKFFAMMKKAISFTPINDIEKFITENICDVEDSIDIRAMQENILYYRQQEKIAQNFEVKMKALDEIHRQYGEVERLRERSVMQKFLIDYGTFQDFDVQIQNAHAEAKKYDEDIAEFEKKCEKLSEKKEELETQRDHFISEISAYRADSGIDVLQEKKNVLAKQIEEANQKIRSFVENIRVQSVRWCARLEKCIAVLKHKEAEEQLQGFLRTFKRLINFKTEDLDAVSAGWFTDIREKYHSVCERIRPILEALQRELHDKKKLADTLHNEIDGLKRGLKAYPFKAVRLKNAIAEGLSRKYHRDIKVSFLADVIDVTDETWHNAVEGYLNTQRMNIIVPPQYFMDAYEIYKAIQLSERIHGYAVVDLERVHAHQPKIQQGSLAEVVKTEDPYVRSYMDYLLGRVVRCERDEELWEHRVSVTKDCMLYSGFAVKAMDQNAYLTPYIGQDAIQRQIISKTAELQDAEMAVKSADAKISELRPIIEHEWFLTEDSPVAVLKAFASPLKQTETLLRQAEGKLIELRGDYNAVQHTSFALTDTATNAEFEMEYQKISDYELPKYRERIEKAKQDAMEQFKNDFLYRLRSNIQHAYEKIEELNAALRRVQFGNDSYRFKIEPNPAYREYYDMIMSDLLEYGTVGLFGAEFTQRYQTTIDNLFMQILSLSEDDTGKTAQNVEMFSQYKTYLSFTLLSTDSSGRTDNLSKSIFIKSGGETQTPFYIAVLASFAQLYRISDASDYGNTVRIVIFDEAFNKMDDDRIIESVRLLRKFELQAIVCTPPDKAADLQPVSDKTLLVHKEQVGKGYQSTVIEWSKEIGEKYEL